MRSLTYVSMRMKKEDLVERVRLLRRSGFVFTDGWGWIFEYERYDYRPVNKDALVEAIRSAELVSKVFGFDEVLVEKDAAQMAWTVLTPEAKTLCKLTWAYVYTWESLLGMNNAADLLAALEVCLLLEPLTEEDLARLRAVNPTIFSREPFRVDPDESGWDLGAEEEPVPPPPRRHRPQPQAPAEPEQRQLSLDRKILI